MLSNGNGSFKSQYYFPANPPQPRSTCPSSTDAALYAQSSPSKWYFDLPITLNRKHSIDLGKNGHQHPPANLVAASAVLELLRGGQYEQAAHLLRQTHWASQAVSDEAEASFLVVAQQICYACSQCRAEIAWHQQAVEAVSQREQELSQQLLALLTRTGDSQVLNQLAKAISSPAVAVASSLQVSLVAYCLGSFQVYLNGQPVSDWPSLKARSIFKYLLAQPGVAVTKDILMDLFWPEADPEAARHNLHQAIHSLRKTLRQSQCETPLILFENDGYRLNPELELHLDFVEFEHHVQAGRRLELAGRWMEAVREYSAAVELYRGDFLEEDLYEDWPNSRRENLRQVYLELVDQLSEYHFQQGEYSQCITLCQQILALDNCHEEAHRRLMRCYQSQGQRRLALRQYQLCVQALETELEVPPLPETQKLYEQISGSSMVLALAD